MIEFLLNREVRSEAALDPNLTVLEYLRGPLGRTGTKEGCASGDCGACTVVLGERECGADGQERLRYRSVNACLLLVPALHGKQLISVEDLQQRGELHSVQQAMVDCHGSQCGFCTPGFVMSLFALQKNHPAYDAEQAHAALAGNLCRCTGYRPILAAAEQACTQAPKADQFDARQTETLARLAAIATADASQSNEVGAAKHTCFMPHTSDAVAELYLAHPEARLLAGGTDLALEITQMHRHLPTLIYLGQVADLQRVDIDATHVLIGAALPLSACYAMLQAEYADFGGLLQRFASVQIRNQGTLGGNIGNASPIGDTPPLLLALGAQVILRRGEVRRTLALHEYFIDYKVTARQPSEFIEAIRVPRAAANPLFRAYKVSKRLDDDISAVCAAFSVHLEDNVVVGARLAFGGMAAIPKRAAAAEAALLGAPWTQASIEAACAALATDFTPLSDMRASQAYRLLVAQNLLRKYFIEVHTPHIATRVTGHV